MSSCVETVLGHKIKKKKNNLNVDTRYDSVSKHKILKFLAACQRWQGFHFWNNDLPVLTVTCWNFTCLGANDVELLLL